MVGVDKDSKVVTLADGRRIQYDALISTLPLDITLNWLGQEEWAKGLTRRWGPPAHCIMERACIVLLLWWGSGVHAQWSCIDRSSPAAIRFLPAAAMRSQQLCVHHSWQWQVA